MSPHCSTDRNRGLPSQLHCSECTAQTALACVPLLRRRIPSPHPEAPARTGPGRRGERSVSPNPTDAEQQQSSLPSHTPLTPPPLAPVAKPWLRCGGVGVGHVPPQRARARRRARRGGAGRGGARRGAPGRGPGGAGRFGPEPERRAIRRGGGPLCP